MASSPEQDKVLNDYMLAWEEACSLGEIPRPSVASLALAGDLCALLLRGQRHADLKDFLTRLGDQLDLYKSNPWVYRAQITENLWSGEFEKVFQLVQHFPFGPSADLVQLWDEAHYRQMERRTGKLLTPVGKFRLRKRFPPPLSIAPHGRKTLSLPREARTKLQSWLLDHRYHPYPSRVEKYDLAELTGLTFKQVSTWFQNNRRRLQHHQDTNWARSPWTDLDIPSLKRSQRSPDGKQYSKGCGVSGRVLKANKKTMEKKKREKSTDIDHSFLGFGYSSICENVSLCNESVSPVKLTEVFAECQNLAPHKQSTTQDRCHQGDGDTKLYCIMCAEDTITPVHQCSPHMEKQKHVKGTEKASCLKEQFLSCLDDNSNLQHCAQQCAVCSQTCLSANLRPASLHIKGGEHFAYPYTSFPTPGFYPIHCLDGACYSAELVTHVDSYPLHLVTPGDSNPLHLVQPGDSNPLHLVPTEDSNPLHLVTAVDSNPLHLVSTGDSQPLHLVPTGDSNPVHLTEPWDISPAHVTAPGDCLMYTELQTMASPHTTFLMYNGFHVDTKLHTADTSIPGAIPVAFHGATDTGIPTAVPGAVHGAVYDAAYGTDPSAVFGAVHGAIPGAVLGADPCATDTCISDAVHVDTVTANLERDPCELTSIACALLDLSINMESLED